MEKQDALLILGRNLNRKDKKLDPREKIHIAKEIGKILIKYNVLWGDVSEIMQLAKDITMGEILERQIQDPPEKTA